MYPSFVLTLNAITYFEQEIQSNYGDSFKKENQRFYEANFKKIADRFLSFTLLEPGEVEKIRNKLDTIVNILHQYDALGPFVEDVVQVLKAVKDRPAYDSKQHPFYDAQRVGSSLRKLLGLHNMEKMTEASDDEVKTFKDGTTFLEENPSPHDVTSMIAELSKAQNIEVGDGTKSVAILASALLEGVQILLAKKVDVTIILDSFKMASSRASQILDKMSTPVDLENDEELIKLAATSLNSKVVSQHSWLLASMAVKAVKRVIDRKSPDNVNLNMIKLVKKLGATVEESDKGPF